MSSTLRDAGSSVEMEMNLKISSIVMLVLLTMESYYYATTTCKLAPSFTQNNSWFGIRVAIHYHRQHSNYRHVHVPVHQI